MSGKLSSCCPSWNTVRFLGTRRTRLARPLPRARVVFQPKGSEPHSQLEVSIEEVEARLKQFPKVPRSASWLDGEQQCVQVKWPSPSSESVNQDKREQAALAAKAAALQLEPHYFRSKLQELLLVLPGVNQDQLLLLPNDVLKNMVCNTASVAARLVQLRTRWTSTPAAPAASQQQPQQRQQRQQAQQHQQQQQQQQQQEAKRDSLDFIWKNLKLLVGSDWDNFLIRTPVASLHGHTGYVTAVAVTPDGRHAVSGGLKSTLRVWDLQAHTCIASLQGHTGRVLSVAITPDGRHAVSGSTDTTLRVWDLHSNTFVATLEGHVSSVNSVAITPDSCYAVSGSEDSTLRVWDLRSHTCSATLTGHAAGVTSVAITPDGCSAVSGSEDKTLRLWDLQACTCTATLDSIPYSAASVAITPDGSTSVSGGCAAALAVWDLKAGCVASIHPDDQILAQSTCTVALTPNGRHAVTTGGWSCCLYVWDLLADPWPLGRSLTAVLEGHTACVNSVTITPDGCYAVSGSNDTSLCVWDLRPHTCRPSLCSMVLQLVSRARQTSQPAHDDSIGCMGMPHSSALLVSAKLRILGQWSKNVLVVMSLPLLQLLLSKLLYYIANPWCT